MQIHDGDTLRFPARCLVVMAGASGSGKSTLARRIFAEHHIVSSDQMRYAITGHEGHQTISDQAKDIAHRLVAAKLHAGFPAVLDSTALRPEDRQVYVGLAQRASAPVVFVFLDVTREESHGSQLTRDRQVPAYAVDLLLDRADATRNALRDGSLLAEGFTAVARLTRADANEIHRARFGRIDALRPEYDLPAVDVIGDLRSDPQLLDHMLHRLGYRPGTNGQLEHPDHRIVLLCGEIGNAATMDRVQQLSDHGTVQVAAAAPEDLHRFAGRVCMRHAPAHTRWHDHQLHVTHHGLRAHDAGTFAEYRRRDMMSVICATGHPAGWHHDWTDDLVLVCAKPAPPHPNIVHVAAGCAYRWPERQLITL